MRFAPFGLASVIVAACALATSPAVADRKDACIGAADRGQLARDRGALREARAELVTCASRSCPPVVWTECARWLADLEPRIPSIVVRATGPGGEDVADVRVMVDGELVKEGLDGRAIEIDPGSRTVRVERSGSEPVELALVVHEGDKSRAVDARFAPPRSVFPVSVVGPGDGARPAPPRADRGVPTASFVLGGLGVVGIAAFTFLGLDMQADVDRLRRECAPSCDPRDVDALRTQTWLANGSLVVGVVALAAAGVLALTSSSGTRATAPSASGARAASPAR